MAAAAAENLLPPLRLQQGDAARAPLRIKAFRLAARTMFGLLFRVRVLGRENLPAANAIICINHLGWAEGFATALYLPVEPRIYALGERPAAYSELWYCRMLNWLEIYVPLDRDSPRGALQTMEGVIRRGGSLALAPEGHLGSQEGTIAPSAARRGLREPEDRRTAGARRRHRRPGAVAAEHAHHAHRQAHLSRRVQRRHPHPRSRHDRQTRE